MAATRRGFAGLIVAAAGLLAAACGGAQSSASVQSGDIVLGSPNAKVTLVEYASMTCGGCAAFHIQDFPRLKSEYIDTGKVKYILREFPNAGFSPSAATAQFMLARCIGRDPESYYRTISTMFAQFDATAQAFRTGQLQPHLTQMARAGGLSDEQFQACVRNQPERDRIAAVEKTGAEQFKVQRTPSFLIDGQLVEPNTFNGLKPLLDQRLGVN